LPERSVDACRQALAPLERLAERARLADAVDTERALAAGRAIPRVAVPLAAQATQVVRLDEAPLDRFCLACQVVDLDQRAAADRVREYREHVLVQPRRQRRGGSSHVVAPERLLELRAYVVERGARIRGHQRADEVECEQQRLGLERREPSRSAELV